MRVHDIIQLNGTWKFSSELEVPDPSLELFHHEWFALYHTANYIIPRVHNIIGGAQLHHNLLK